MAKYQKIRITKIDNRYDEDSLTIEECGIAVDETFYADVFDHGPANIRSKKNVGNLLKAGDSIILDEGEYEVVE